MQNSNSIQSEHIGARKNDVETAEFHTPKLGLSLEEYIKQEDTIGVHHLGRYEWASMVLKTRAPKKVLDIACGAGYGSYMLAHQLPTAGVTGVDYDIRGIEAANNQYSNPNLIYRRGNLVTWQFEDTENPEPLGVFDAIISFDTIEHLLHREIALIRVAQNLTSDGVFLFSTPCLHDQSILNPGWEHHKIEYSSKDLQNLLKRFFRVVHIPENGSLPSKDFWDNVINKDKLPVVSG